MSLSVIIPSFNTEKWIELAIRSVVNEGVEDYEIIVVDDASTDSTAAVVEDLSKQNNKIILIKLPVNTPGGAGIPSNIGLQKTTKDFVAFLDSDDWVQRGYFSKQMSVLKQLDADFSISSYVSIDAQTHEKIPAYDFDVWPADKGREQSIDPRKALALSPEPWRKVYKSEFLRKEGLKFPEADHFNEDYPFHWSVCTHAKSAVLVPQTGYFHRVNRDGQTTVESGNRYTSFLPHSLGILEELKKKNDKKAISYFQSWLVRHSRIIEAQLSEKEKREIFSAFHEICERANFRYISLEAFRNNNVNRLYLFLSIHAGDYSEYTKALFLTRRKSRRAIKRRLLKKLGPVGIARFILSRICRRSL
ncbi:hypothetical protein RUESEDTHA_03187 [Ruegeria sp. THAF57]|uniref:glycosyltransferase n=1 Tax=Ruegeria sp. THAF57 TaxID=2744555 RepID=UPI0015DFC76F|nr:glycosyltransferase family 2 protein [Ruegeria sp. THAF57]CAD0186280.1 hypothetical protein RUESEDTHA_03187 [Ruegeria sp. THAF57]